MNWCDFIVIGISVGFALIGLKKGFLMSVYKLLSFLIAIVLSYFLYPYVAKFLMGTTLHDKIYDSILKNLMLQQPAIGAQGKSVATNAVVEHLKLPEFMKEGLIKSVTEKASVGLISEIFKNIAERMTEMAIGIISIVLVYILVRIILIFAKYFIEGVSKLPVFKQMDKFGGFALGAVEGLLTVYIFCTILMIFAAAPSFKSIFDSIDESILAKFVCENNFIYNLLF